MVVARASGMDLASILRQNTFLSLGVRPLGGPGSARDGGTRGRPRTGGHGAAPGGRVGRHLLKDVARDFYASKLLWFEDLPRESGCPPPIEVSKHRRVVYAQKHIWTPPSIPGGIMSSVWGALGDRP